VAGITLMTIHTNRPRLYSFIVTDSTQSPIAINYSSSYKYTHSQYKNILPVWYAART